MSPLPRNCEQADQAQDGGHSGEHEWGGSRGDRRAGNGRNSGATVDASQQDCNEDCGDGEDNDLDGEFEAAFESVTANASQMLANARLSPNDVAEISLSAESSDSFLLEPEMRVPHGPGAGATALGLPPRGFDGLDAGLDEFLRDENSEERSLRDLLETS